MLRQTKLRKKPQGMQLTDGTLPVVLYTIITHPKQVIVGLEHDLLLQQSAGTYSVNKYKKIETPFGVPIFILTIPSFYFHMLVSHIQGKMTHSYYPQA